MNCYILTSDRLVNKTCKMIDWNFRKFWPEINVIILGYSYPDIMPTHAKFISIGVDNGVDSVCSQVSSYFESIQDEFFVFEVDDKPLIHKVNHSLFNILCDILEKDKKIGRIGLTKDNFKRSHKVVGVIDSLSIFKNDHNTEYRLSCTYSIWNKKFFIDYAKKCTTLWDFEVRGSELSKNSDWMVFGSNPWILDSGHLYRKGGKLIDCWYCGIYTSNKFSDEDVKYIRNIYDI